MPTLKSISYLAPTLLAATLLSPPATRGEGPAPLINEVMALNSSTRPDEDGDYADWVELYNPGDVPVDLAGYGLSDRPDNPSRWIFPQVAMAPGAHLLLFASGKDRSAVVSHWETIISAGAQWSYRKGGTDIPGTWNAVDFDDSQWQSGVSPIGSRDDDATSVPASASLYLRRAFTLARIDEITACLLHLGFSDGFVAYINGIEVARANIGVSGTPDYNTRASQAREMQIPAGGHPDAFHVQNIGALLRAGRNVIAIQVHNKMASLSDISVIPFLSFGMTDAPADPQGLADILTSSVSYLHTSFSISAAGETLVLTDAAGGTCDSVATGQARPDVSVGRQPDGAADWVYFTEPTPGASNTTPGFEGHAEPVTTPTPGGFYDDAVEVELQIDSPTADLRYTLDGSEPSEASAGYTGPISIQATAVLRARAFDPGRLPGSTATHTYFIGEDITLPVVSLSTHPDNMFSDETGIYVFGPDASYDDPVPYWNANFWQDWEHAVHVELFEADGSPALSLDAGISIGAGWSRLFPQKSFSIDARARYGYNSMDYQFFPELPIHSFDSILLRNGGNDSAGSLLRDALGTRLGEDVGLDVKAYRPVVAFVNGAYWGVYAFREKFNVDYLVNHHGVDRDRVDLIEKAYQTDEVPAHDNVQAGEVGPYRELVAFIAEHDMSDAANYEYVKTQVDVTNLITYCVTKIYACDYNFNTNNVRWWRPRTPHGKWQWLQYDNDRTFGSRTSTTYSANMLKTALDSILGKELLVELLRNSEFRAAFVNCLADYLNTAFQPDRVISRLRELKSVIEPEMERHIARWDIDYWQGKIGTLDNWYADLEGMETFAERRPEFVTDHFRDRFDLGGSADVSIAVAPAGGGVIRLNFLTLDSFPWSGTYFQDIPISLAALPNPGYRFAGWSGVSVADTSAIALTLSDDISLTANFIEDSGAANPIVINEINYNSSAESDPEDWVELHNPLDTPVNISGWRFRDGNEANLFVLPENTIVTPGDYLVLCSDAAAFHAIFADVENHVGDLGFSLSNGGEALRLYNDRGALIDSLTYGDVAPWPVEPDGNGSTLALQNPSGDNALPENWAPSRDLGTPGAVNDRITAIEETATPTLFSLGRNYPNPFNSTTTLELSLPASGPVSLVIYNVMGQRERELMAGVAPSGAHTVRWDGKDDRGVAVSSGIYFCRLEAGEHVAVQAMVHLK